MLTREPALVDTSEGNDGNLEIIRMTCAYEAASEILAAPAAALLLDLRLLHPRHVQLLRLARQTNTPTYAFGHLPLGINSNEFDGVTMIPRDEVAAALKHLAQIQQGRVGENAPAATASAAASDAAPIAQEQLRADLVDLPSIPLSQSIAPLDEDDELNDLFEQATEVLAPETLNLLASVEPAASRRRNLPETPRKWAGKSPAIDSELPAKPDREGLLTSQELSALLEIKP